MGGGGITLRLSFPPVARRRREERRGGGGKTIEHGRSPEKQRPSQPDNMGVGGGVLLRCLPSSFDHASLSRRSKIPIPTRDSFQQGKQRPVRLSSPSRPRIVLGDPVPELGCFVVDVAVVSCLVFVVRPHGDDHGAPEHRLQVAVLNLFRHRKPQGKMVSHNLKLANAIELNRHTTCMKKRGSVVSLSFIFPHPPEHKKQNKKVKARQKTRQDTSRQVEKS